MSPLGKFTLAIIGLRFAGAVGFFWGMFFGHILIDSTIVCKKIEEWVDRVDENIRLLLPYRACRYYNRVDGFFRGKIWGGVLGGVLFGFSGFILLFILGHFLFDTPRSRHAKAFRSRFDLIWKENWCKILGAIIGFSLQSRILIFVGVIIGFFFDRWYLEKGFSGKLNRSCFSRFWLNVNPLKFALSSKEARKNAFVQAMAGLAAKISKADGLVSQNEVHLFKQLFNIPQKANRSISRVFNKAKESVSGYEYYAEQIRLIAKDDLELKESVIENLFKIALVDGDIEPQEREILQNIALLIDLPLGNFRAIEEAYRPKPQNKGNVKDFYSVLGVFCDASDVEIKKRWRELTNMYHPDRVQARGASEAEIEMATLKMAEINNAYETIIKLRKVA